MELRSEKRIFQKVALILIELQFRLAVLRKCVKVKYTVLIFSCWQFTKRKKEKKRKLPYYFKVSIFNTKSILQCNNSEIQECKFYTTKAFCGTADVVIMI